MSKSIFDGAKPISWRFPDRSVVYCLISLSLPLYGVVKSDGRHLVIGEKWAYSTPEDAAQALADIGQGPASVKGGV